MNTVTLSPKFQVVIPKEVREKLELAPGTKLQVFVAGERIELLPERKAREMRGFLRGLDTSVVRESDRF